MTKIYGGFRKDEKDYSYGADKDDFRSIRAEILVDDVVEGLDFMANTFGKTIQSAPGYSWQYEDAMNHDRREELKAMVATEAVEEIAEVEEVVEMVTCNCGHRVPKSMVMSTSTGTSCPDCYDMMSE